MNALVCAVFSTFSTVTNVGDIFSDGSYVFQALFTPSSMTVYADANPKFLAIPKIGIKIKLPSTSKTVTLNIGAFAGPVSVYYYSASGKLLGSDRTKTQNKYEYIQFDGSGGDEITYVVIADGNNEGNCLLYVKNSCT